MFKNKYTLDITSLDKNIKSIILYRLNDNMMKANNLGSKYLQVGFILKDYIKSKIIFGKDMETIKREVLDLKVLVDLANDCQSRNWTMCSFIEENQHGITLQIKIFNENKEII